MKKIENSKYSIKDYCKTLPVSETGYYKWIKNKDKKSAAQKLLDEIYKILDDAAIFDTKRPTCGPGLSARRI